MNRQTQKNANRGGMWKGLLINQVCVLLAVAASTALWSGCDESDEMHAMAARAVPGIRSLIDGPAVGSGSNLDSARVYFPSSLKGPDLGDTDRTGIADLVTSPRFFNDKD